ncbi:hypothetical protein WJX73_000256 [Symbiochloris irregularis]|uniref:Uncharacterized protein n=1 Tax=Symbiochloris irregularis TaxID=706552 RepID=A0AAW1PBK3_9CHLO
MTLSCSEWHNVLSKPQARGLWGDVDFQLDKFTWHSTADCHDAHYPAERLLPAFRWMAQRAPGMSSLKLKARTSYGVKLWCCRAKQCDDDTCCLENPRLIEQAITLFITSLQGQRVDVHVELQCKQHFWPVHRPPAMQQREPALRDSAHRIWSPSAIYSTYS